MILVGRAVNRFGQPESGFSIRAPTPFRQHPRLWPRNALAAFGAWMAMLATGCPTQAMGTAFLHARGTAIVDGAGQPIILRGVGLGGWMVQEGYMLQLKDLGTQKRIRARIEQIVGTQGADAFYRSWLDNAVTKGDLDRISALGFNSVRVPLHHALFMAADGHLLKEGFDRLDRLVSWAKADRLYVILDLHAAAGGQGADLAISDRDPDLPSLWDGAGNLAATIRLWGAIAHRYRNNATVGGYDLLNEPNWDFTPDGGHGCEEKANAPLRDFYAAAIKAIRQVDRGHMVVIEGNCWGNDYAGLLPVADDNLVLSFHKYWNANDAPSIAPITALRDRYNVPVWLGETGENTDEWYRDAIRLMELHGIGWALWPWKKMGTSSPQEIVVSPGWERLAAWMTGKGPMPSTDEAREALMQLAVHDVRIENTREHAGVVAAVLSPAAVP